MPDFDGKIELQHRLTIRGAERGHKSKMFILLVRLKTGSSKKRRNVEMTKKFAIAVAFVFLAGAITANAQLKRCGLDIYVTENDANGLPVQNTTATAVKVGSKKVIKAAFAEAMPVFENLAEGIYKLTLKKAGYKTTVKTVEIDCSEVEDDDPSISDSVFLQKGNGDVIYVQPTKEN